MTIFGKNDISHWKTLVGPFLVHKLWVPDPHPPSNTSLGGGGIQGSLFAGAYPKIVFVAYHVCPQELCIQCVSRKRFVRP